jgi:hypothetical protein
MLLDIAGVHFPAAMRRWLSTGYSTYVHVSELWVRTPRRQAITREEQCWCEKQIEDVLLPVGAIEEVAIETLPTKVVVCNVVVAYKEGRMDRMCWSGKPVNKGLDQKRFRMEAWDTIAALAQEGDWAFSLDLEKGYMQVGLDERMKNFCVFRVGQKVYRYRALPFGLASAPRDFSKMVRKVAAVFRKMGIRVTFFIDDLLF